METVIEDKGFAVKNERVGSLIPSCSSSAGDQGPHVGRELQDHDGGRAADGPPGAGQPAGQVALRLQPGLVSGGNHHGASDGWEPLLLPFVKNKK